MKSLWVILLITVALTFSSSAQEHTKRPPKPPPNTTSAPTDATNANRGGWAPFTSDKGRFSVLLPGTPEEKVETKQTNHGPYTTHLLILRQPPNVFLVGWVDYDPSFNFNRHTELEMNRDNFLKGVEAKLLTNRFLMIDNYQALEFTAETAQRIFTSRVYIVGRRPYQIVIGSPKGVNDSVNVDRFFNSFKVSLN